MLSALPLAERPRERLIAEGVDALSLIELLAIVLGSGTRGMSVLRLAEQLLHRFGSLDELLDASLAELKTVKGIGRVKAVQLQAVFALARRSRRSVHVGPQPLGSPEEVYALMGERLVGLAQEVLVVLLRDIKGYVIHQQEVCRGTLSQVLAHPREVFYGAIRHHAASLILIHNHPSGDPTPSSADLDLTRVLIEAGKILSIPLDDHVIIARRGFVSLRQKGFFPHLRGRY